MQTVLVGRAPHPLAPSCCTHSWLLRVVRGVKGVSGATVVDFRASWSYSPSSSYYCEGARTCCYPNGGVEVYVATVRSSVFGGTPLVQGRWEKVEKENKIVWLGGGGSWKRGEKKTINEENTRTLVCAGFEIFSLRHSVSMWKTLETRRRGRFFSSLPQKVSPDGVLYGQQKKKTREFSSFPPYFFRSLRIFWEFFHGSSTLAPMIEFEKRLWCKFCLPPLTPISTCAFLWLTVAADSLEKVASLNSSVIPSAV